MSVDLSAFNRVSLIGGQTPIEAMPRLSAWLEGPRLFVKRDDSQGVGLGGNKLRKLEFLLGDARERGVETVLTVGAIQSNHARQTAAACARLGLGCELFLQQGRQTPVTGLHNGNVLLDRLFGARIHRLGPQEDREAAMARRATELTNEGRCVLSIPVGGSTGLGNLGYVACANEIVEQTQASGLEFAAIAVAVGSGGSHAGLLAGRLSDRMRVVGVAVEGQRREKQELVADQYRQTCKILDQEGRIDAQQIEILDGFVGPGYARPSEAMREALDLAARFEGLVLDPVYTGKAFAGFLAMARSGEFTREQNLVFLHTGGAPGLFGYPESAFPDLAKTFTAPA